ncbi:hypothetical protein HX813_24055 [Pseudomonas yamanorum]|uniref:hypothetical protein n=1 Tax=Pseudomonas yamanorum TaxID=515393 RepID=UPI0015A3C2FD|nr:hypothetical protein [Pseudomonas yamanorum]NVZ91311.1 hypothetical protein [Pseudomonas yamanorum]
MKLFVGALALVALVGCSTSGMQQGAPSFSAQSQKTPQQYARCLGPKWQEINPSTSSIETETGYKISASTAFTGVVALAVIEQSHSGSLVKVFLPTDWVGTSGWKDSAKTCI